MIYLLCFALGNLFGFVVFSYRKTKLIQQLLKVKRVYINSNEQWAAGVTYALDQVYKL